MPDVRRVASVLQLVTVEADLHAETGRAAGAAARYRRALALAGFLAGRAEKLLDAELAARLVERAGELDHTPAQRMQLARVLEALGRYADAEDAVFAAIDAAPEDTGLVDAGIAFYQRLLALEPERRAAGGRPLEVVHASLAELLGIQPGPDADEEEPAW
jgi:hypothetical protein